MLRQHIQQITEKFALAIIEAIRAATLSQLEELGGTARILPAARTPVRGRSRTTKSGRLARRSEAEIAAVIDKVAALLKTAPLRSEHIRAKLDLEPREMPRILREGVASKKLTIVSGQKRATLYSAPGAKAGSKKPAKKPAKKK